MFTGIVEHVGTVLAVKVSPAGKRLRIDLGRELRSSAAPGASIAVDGVCLTVSELGSGTWSEFDVVPETLSRTTLGSLRANETVNLERALSPAGRLDGHFVQGHIDATATVARVVNSGGEVRLAFTLDDPEQAIYIVPKGSVAISGTSLTVVDVDGATFGVALIPTTVARTTLAVRKVGDKVNIETDMLAKIVVNYLKRSQDPDPAKSGDVTFEQLREAGWL
jgi:riboflavin synthase